MSKPYLLMSDQHCHDWSQFAETNAEGENSRLMHILDEMETAYNTLISQGGNTAVFAGDLFHVRGRVKPSVLNPVVERLKKIHASGKVKTYAIPGNHDLEGSSTNTLGNAMQVLSLIDGFEVITSATYIGDIQCVIIPWEVSLPELTTILTRYASSFPHTDAIIHAPMNHVIQGIPNTALDPDDLAKLGYNRVFAGHYHNHKEFCGGKVYSIGALTHQTWGDVHSKSGYMLVWPNKVTHIRDCAPKFVDISNGDFDEDQISGNYIRFTCEDLTHSEVLLLKEQLKKDYGALGVQAIPIKKKNASVRAAAHQAVSNSVGQVDHAATIKKHIAQKYAAQEESARELIYEMVDAALKQARQVGAAE